LSGCGNGFLNEARAFRDYYEQKFKTNIVKYEHGIFFCERGTTIPKGLSDKDILDIRKILGLKFYELSEFEGSPIFYGIWMNGADKFQGFSGVPYFFDTYEEALKKAEENPNFTIRTLNGTLEELSNSPILLKSLINSAYGIEYDEEKKVLRTKHLSTYESIALNELLKVKMFEIKEIPMSTVENIEHWIYEEM